LSQTIDSDTHSSFMKGRFLNAEQAAEYLCGLNSRTVTRWAREGYLPAYPIGEGRRRLWRFLEADLRKWMLLRGTRSFSADDQPGEHTLSPATDVPTGGFFQ
jgi:excisionase family DNA binding protein